MSYLIPPCFTALLSSFRQPGMQPISVRQTGPMLIVVLLLAVSCNIDSTPASTPDSPIFFPRQKPVAGERAIPAGEIIGELIVVDGCLRLEAREGDASYAVVWPPGFVLKLEDEAIQILDSNSQTVAQVGAEIYLGGGGTQSVERVNAVDEQLQRELPARCRGPYWLVGDVIQLPD